MYIKPKLIFFIKKTLCIFLYSHREVMDCNKLTKLYGIMKDNPYSLLTLAKYFNEIAILDHSATRLMKAFLRELCSRLQGLAHAFGKFETPVSKYKTSKNVQTYFEIGFTLASTTVKTLQFFIFSGNSCMPARYRKR